jgi:uncharacterized phiE125 gp8 family phage protein
MSPILIAAPALEPVSLSTAKLYLRVDGADEDDLIRTLLVAARLLLEAASGQMFITQGWRIVLDRWPVNGELRLPLAPVTAISAVRALDAAGSATAVAVSALELSAKADPPFVLEQGVVLQPGRARAVIEIDLLAGYGATAAELPAGVDLAVFDAGLNAGPSRAVRWLQEVAGVEPDGVIGPLTRVAVLRRPAAAIIAGFSARRLPFLQRLSTWRAFGRGWSRRVRETEAAALAMAGQGRSATLQTRRTQQTRTMDGTKSLLSSKTLWSNLVGLAAVLLSTFGIDTSGVDSTGLSQAIPQAVAAISFIAATVFRVTATKRLVVQATGGVEGHPWLRTTVIHDQFSVKSPDCGHAVTVRISGGCRRPVGRRRCCAGVRPGGLLVQRADARGDFRRSCRSGRHRHACCAGSRRRRYRQGEALSGRQAARLSRRDASSRRPGWSRDG